MLVRTPKLQQRNRYPAPHRQPKRKRMWRDHKHDPAAESAAKLERCFAGGIFRPSPLTGAAQKPRVLLANRRTNLSNQGWPLRVGDVLHYQRGSRKLGIAAHTYARVLRTNPKENLLMVEKADGKQLTYAPSRLRGISAYREIEREFTLGDCIVFTAPIREFHVANRDLGTIQQIGKDGKITISLDGYRRRSFVIDSKRTRHFDHGYAMTSHSSQGLTSDRVLINIDTASHPELINSRFAYVSVSRASQDAQIFTNDASTIAELLSRDVSKASALELSHQAHSHRAELRPRGRNSGGLGLSI